MADFNYTGGVRFAPDKVVDVTADKDGNPTKACNPITGVCLEGGGGESPFEQKTLEFVNNTGHEIVVLFMHYDPERAPNEIEAANAIGIGFEPNTSGNITVTTNSKYFVLQIFDFDSEGSENYTASYTADGDLPSASKIAEEEMAASLMFGTTAFFCRDISRITVGISA